MLALLAAGLMHLLMPVALGGLLTNTAFSIFYLWFLPSFVLINLYLMFFNLLPIPPLDGSSIFAFFLPMKALPTYYKIQQYSFPIFLVLLFFIPYLFNVNPISLYLNATAGAFGNLLFPF